MRRSRYSTGSLEQSFLLMGLITLISVGGTFLTNIGMGAGIRLNSDATLHPYDHFTSWRYGLAGAMPVLAMALTWIYRVHPRITMINTLHMVIAAANLGWMGVVLAFEVVVLTQCNDPSGPYIYDHPQCINRLTPTHTTPDVSWQLIFAGIITNTACAVWWMIQSFTIQQTSDAFPFQEGRFRSRDEEAAAVAAATEGGPYETIGTASKLSNKNPQKVKGLRF